MTKSIKFSKIRTVKTPTRSYESAGIDFYVPSDFNGGFPLFLAPQEHILIPSGIKMNIPEHHALIAFNKSGVATKKKLDVMACVCDSDYQGEIHISLINSGNESQQISPDDKIVQFVLIPIAQYNPKEVSLENLYEEESSRGESGFGSSDHK